jgi:hypothetical protein
MLCKLYLTEVLPSVKCELYFTNFSPNPSKSYKFTDFKLFWITPKIYFKQNAKFLENFHKKFPKSPIDPK